MAKLLRTGKKPAAKAAVSPPMRQEDRLSVNGALSVAMLAAFALAAGAVYLARRGGARRQVWLMLIMAAVLVGNVLIWAIPAP